MTAVDEGAIELTGGRTTRGVVRIGDTVRRPVGRHSVFVHALLRHLAERGFAGAPEFIGIDAAGREVLSYLPGEVPHELGSFSSMQLTAAARLLRRLHDATAHCALVGREEVVCHGDASPCNCVFVAGVPTAFIDFDAAHAGSRREDVGYAAWLWLDLGNPTIDAQGQGRRLAQFFHDYGADADDAVRAVLDAQSRLARAAAASRATRSWALECRRWVRRHAVALSTGLSGQTAVARGTRIVTPATAHRRTASSIPIHHP